MRRTSPSYLLVREPPNPVDDLLHRQRLPKRIRTHDHPCHPERRAALRPISAQGPATADFEREIEPSASRPFGLDYPQTFLKCNVVIDADLDPSITEPTSAKKCRTTRAPNLDRDG